MRVMIVDDHLLIRRIVREVIEKEGDVEVVGEASNGQEAETLATQTHPDVVLMDLEMPECNGFEATQRVLSCSPETRVVIFTASQREQDAFRAIQSGAIGYITKDIEPDALVQALRFAARNELCIPRQLATRVLTHIRSYTPKWESEPVRSHTAKVSLVNGRETAQHRQQAGTGTIHRFPTSADEKEPLTEREREVLNLIRKGHKNREIARELAIAESTVHKHVQNILDKVHARNRTEAIYLTGERMAM